jgi:ankyrin repeat protein
MDDPGVIGLVNSFEHSVDAGIAVALRDPRLIHERTSLGETALHLIALGDCPHAIQSLVKLGADVNALCDACETPLSLAVSIGRSDTVRILLEVGASVRVEGQLEPLLHKAVRSGSIAVVQAILDAGCDVNKQADFGESPLHVAADDDLVEIATLLMSRGADPLLKSTYGGTALQMAERSGSSRCVALLSNRH